MKVSIRMREVLEGQVPLSVVGEPFEVNTKRLYNQSLALCSAIQEAEKRLNKQRAKCNERQHVLGREGYQNEHELGDCDCQWRLDSVERLNGLHSTISCILLQTDKYENG
jgi:hypothetical protein